MGALMTGAAAMAQDTTTGLAAAKQFAAQIKSNPTAAAATAKALTKEYKKDAKVLAAIGRAYLDAGKVAEAQAVVDKATAVKDCKNSPEIWTLAGDIAVEKNDPGTAAQDYETAITYDKTYSEAYIKYSDIYRVSSPTLAKNKLQELLAINPNDNKVMRKIAQVANSAGNFKESAEQYGKMDPSQMKEDDYSNYIFALWRIHQWDKGIQIATECHAKYPRSATFNRLLLYLNTDKQNFAEGEKAGQDLFNNSDSAKYQYLDYTYYGYALNGMKKYNESIPVFEKAYELDSTRNDALSNISDAFENLGDYTNAVTYYEKYMDTLNGQDKTADKYFQLGKLNYEKGGDNKLAQNVRDDANRAADKAFAKVQELSPELPQAPLWRGRANSALDPDSKLGLAKPFYEKTLELLGTDKTKNTSLFIECYKYLGYQRYLAKDAQGAKAIWSKIFEVDPGNEWAKNILKELK